MYRKNLTASSCWSLKALTEMEEPAEMGKPLESGATDPFASRSEIRGEAVGAWTNTVQPVPARDC